MRAIQYLMVVVIVVAGVVGVGLTLELIPVTRVVLPEWAANLLPSIDSPAAGWLIAGVVAVLVVAGLVHGAADRALTRRGDDAVDRPE